MKHLTEHELADLLRAEFVKGFELAHELQPCGHSRGDCRDANYKPGDEFCESRCIGCEREAALKAEVRRNEAQWWADEQVEKDGELSARAAIRLAEIDAAVQGRRNEQ